MVGFAEDFRYGIRQIRHSPGFFVVAALLLAVGVATSTQIFTLVDALFLRELPVNDPRSLVQLFEQQAKRPAEPYFDYSLYKQLAHDSSTLSNVVGQVETTRAMEQQGHVERIHAEAVTGNFFRDLGITPVLGRALFARDDHVVVLSHACWARSFGRDPNVIGRPVRLQGHVYTIVGVTQQAFTGTTLDSSPDLWMPFADLHDFERIPDPNLDHYVIEIIGRLRPGISARQAQRETAAFWDRHLREAEIGNPTGYSGLNRGELQVRSITYGVSPMRNQSTSGLMLLLVGTGLMLLMICANVSGLLLSRATARESETAIRIALGASRARIMRRWFVESLLLTVVGGVAGLSIAYAGMPLLMRWLPPAHGIGFDPGEVRPLDLYIAPDLRVAAFVFGILANAAALCALAPAWRSWGWEINIALKSTTSDRRTHVFQSLLCTFQVALCTTLLISAGQLTRSLANLFESNAGFDRDHVTVFSIDPHVRGYDSQRTWLLEQRLLDSVRGLPGVDGAGLAYRGLMRGIGLGSSVVFPGQTGGIINTSMNSVTPEYFGVMRIRLLEGRNFLRNEMAPDQQPQKVIVNSAFVRKFLDGRDPLGQQFDTGRRFQKPRYEIIGVVSDTKYRSLREIPPPIFYTDDFGPKAYPDSFILHVRSHGDPHAVIQPVRRLLNSIDPELPLYEVATLSEEVDRSLWQERLISALASFFGIFASLLAAVGLYGLLAYSVSRRQQEIGLRMALGADSWQVIRPLVRGLAPLLAIGFVVGAALSWSAGSFVRSLLYEVQVFDLAAEIPAIVLLLAIGILGAAVPALRAMRVDPSTALRGD
jgi:putative ABC transport system permease protein